MVDAPPAKKSASDIYFEMVEALCGHFAGLSPFEVMNSDIKDVYDLYVDLAIYAYKKSNHQNNNNGAIWVTSKTATWH